MWNLKRKICCFLVIVLVGTFAFGSESQKSENPTIPTPGVVTMVDLGADRCVPCKMMAPIIEELKQEYPGRASIIFIDVWKHPEAGRRFGIQSIPTQIFYDKDGNEKGRHVGYLSKEGITNIFKELGVPEKAEVKP